MSTDSFSTSSESSSVEFKHTSFVISCGDLPARTINQKVRNAAARGVGEIRLLQAGARHNIGVGLPQGVRLYVEGSAGYYLGGLNDGATIEVTGSVGWGAAESMRDGEVLIGGDAGNAVAASIRSGTVIVKGNASTRAGIAMKGGSLVIGGDAGPGAGFMMQKGVIVIRGDADDGVADSMYAGTVFVGGKTGAFGADVVEEELSDDDRKLVQSLLEMAGLEPPPKFRKLVSGRRLWNFHRSDLEVWKSAL